MATALTPASFRAAVRELAGREPAFARALEVHGPPEFWRRPAGFATLVLFILEQQVSIASARAAFDRLETRLGKVTPDGLLSLDDAELRTVGFSRQKTRYARALARSVAEGETDLELLASLPDDEVRRRLCRLPGIGPWTADVYLLACLLRPDAWPAGDRALQVAASEVLCLDRVPGAGELEALAEPWRPHRASAARLLWHAYLGERGR